MKTRYLSMALSVTFGVAAAALLALGLGQAPAARADNVYQPLPFTEAWGTDLDRFETDNDWSNVPGIEGYGGTDLPLGPDVDPRDVLTPSTAGGPVILANQIAFSNSVASSAAVFEFEPATGGVTELEVALHANSTYHAPFLILYLDATGLEDIQVAYDVTDIDPNNADADQEVALQYRVGESGQFTYVENSFIEDATDLPENSKRVTPISVTLPPAANGAAQLQLRILTTNSTGADEFIAIDNISVSGSPIGPVTYDEFRYLPIIFR